MMFEDILDQAVVLLRRRGRITYRALQAQFQLDDGLLETLKDELLFSHPVVDKEGRGLEWTGEKGEVPEPGTQPDEPAPQPVVESTQPVQETSSPVEPHTPDAERRQLTVMFCDLVGSTALSGALDPEDLREVVQAYQAVCTDVIQRFEGYVAQHLGDGLLCYFGYPTAHEDDAQRAVRTGLCIIDAMTTLNQRLQQTHRTQLAVRISIHTGVVVVGGIGAGERQEQLALGETPNVAARIQALAEPDTVVISADTHRLIQGYFDCEPMGEQKLRGVAEPIGIYLVVSESGVQGRLDIANTHGLTPLVGRESEVTLLMDRWVQCRDGHGQVILLSGEAGIGKSRLVQVLKDHIAEVAHIRLECRNSPYFTNSALYPIIDMVQRTLQFQVEDTPEQRLEKLEEHLSQYRLPLEETVPIFAELLSLPVPANRFPLLNLTPQRQRQKTLEAIVTITLELSERQPVLFILEDLHWTDPTTLELLDLLLDQTPTASICALLTYRPEFQPTWSHRSYLTDITVNRLSSIEVEQVVESLTDGKHLPDVVLQEMVERTDGVPLYVEEMTKAVLESGVLKEANDYYELTGSLSTLAVPATLQDSLMARLDRLMTAKAVAQLGATIGRQFSYELLHAVSDLDETMLQHELGRLVEAELVYQRGLPPQATYTFKHALVQDTAYESLLRSTRQGYHRRIAEVLEERFPETTETQPELLGHHYTEAGLNQQAIAYCQQAGESASQRSANAEAIEHLSKGLELLKMLPSTTEHSQRELDLLIALGPPLIAIKGYAAPEVEQVMTHAHILCQQVGDSQRLFSVLHGLWWFHCLRAEYTTARHLGEELLSMAQQQQDLVHLAASHRVLATTLIFLGEFHLTRDHLEQCLVLTNAADYREHATRLGGSDIRTACLTWMNLIHWLLGYPEQALGWDKDALNLCHEIEHPFSLAWTHVGGAWLYQLRREEHAVHERIEDLVTLSTEQGFPFWMAWGVILRGWLLSMRGRASEGVAQIHQSLSEFQGTGSEFNQTYFLDLLVTAYEREGQIEKALAVLAEALSLVDRYGERWREAELHRHRGELLLQQSPDNAAEAEICYQQALDVARSQQAKSWELRAATSLAYLWQSQGKSQEAHDLLVPVYNWFAEGFDTADLKEAKELLVELEG